MIEFEPLQVGGVNVVQKLLLGADRLSRPQAKVNNNRPGWVGGTDAIVTWD